MADAEFREMWDDYKEAQRERRLERLVVRQGEIKSLTALGYQVRDQDRGYCFRINGVYDLYPIHNRWHHLPSGRRGGTPNLKDFILQSMPLQDSTASEGDA